MKQNLTNNTHIKRFLQFFRKRRSSAYITPLRDWTYGLVLATIVFFIGGIAIAIDFYAQFYVPIQIEDVPVQTLTYRANSVKDYAKKLTDREHTFTELRKNTQYVPPPQVETAPATTVPENSTTTATSSAKETLPLAADAIAQ
jgi:hypothetical protein